MFQRFRSSVVRLAALVCAVTALMHGAAQAQTARVITNVDRARIEVGEDIELTIQADGRYEELEVPSTDGFDVVGQRFTQINRKVSRTYVLRSRAAGNYVIGAARLKLQGRVIAESPTIPVVVTEPATAAPVEGEAARDLSALEKETVFIRWSTERTRYMLGEPFVVTLELWMASGLTSRQADLVKAAKFEGLLVEDLPRDDARQPERKVIGRSEFQVQPLMSVIATPLKAGRVLVDATTARFGVAEDDWAMVARTVTRSTQAFWIDIAEVPSEGRPPGFNASHVGQFEMKSSLRDDRSIEPKQVRTGQRLVLRAEVQGTGNLAGLQPPEVRHDGTWEASLLPGQNEDRITRDSNGMRGTRVFQWLVVPKEPGPRPIPVIELHAFDSLANRFKTTKSDARLLEVTGESAVAKNLDANLLGEDVGPIFTASELADDRTDRLVSHPFYLAALGLCLLAFLWVEVAARRRARDASQPGLRASRQALANAKKRLKHAERAAKDGLQRDVHAHLARALTSFLEEKANIPAAGLTHVGLRQAMARAGFPSDVIESLIVEIENCEFGRFAPGDANPLKSRELFDRVTGLLARLDVCDVRRLP